jgi:hypothetical protein
MFGPLDIPAGFGKCRHFPVSGPVHRSPKICGNLRQRVKRQLPGARPHFSAGGESCCFLSDVHLTDGSSGTTINPAALAKFARFCTM